MFLGPHGTRRRILVAGAATAAAAALAVAAPLATATKASKSGTNKGRLAIHLCAWGHASGALSSAEVSGECSEKHGQTKTRHTPWGNVGLAIYTAKFGTPSGVLVPQHTAVVTAARETGTGKAAKYIEKQARLKVLEEGVLVAGGSGRFTATWNGDTYSCENPPTGDCTHSNFEAAKGRWLISVGLLGAPPGVPGGQEDEASQNEDDPQDLQQEEALKGPAVSLGLYISAKL